MYLTTSLFRHMNIQCVFKMHMNFTLNITYANGLKPTIFHFYLGLLHIISICSLQQGIQQNPLETVPQKEYLKNRSYDALNSAL